MNSGSRIELLSPRLANQIAAGEVVERPASVIKELLENSIDSGAKRIDVDVEQGGVKLLRVRDDGSGISSDDLPLALARHATSKIRDLEDLERVMSLGFRGEALASISSVARLTLTSRTRGADQAWQVETEGRDMAPRVQPAAHPVGTSVEVRDLFFNTPARRKFLKAEKTEFDHLQEVIKRLALARFDVAFHLRHNGKTILSLHEANDDAARARRVAAVCGAGFLEQALPIEIERNGLRLWGWVGLADVLPQPGGLAVFLCERPGGARQTGGPRGAPGVSRRAVQWAAPDVCAVFRGRPIGGRRQRAPDQARSALP